MSEVLDALALLSLLLSLITLGMIYVFHLLRDLGISEKSILFKWLKDIRSYVDCNGISSRPGDDNSKAELYEEGWLTYL